MPPEKPASARLIHDHPDRELVARLRDQVSAPARSIAGAMDGMRAAQRQNARQIEAMRGRMVAAVAAGYALQRAIRAPVMASANFEAAMKRVEALTGETGAGSRPSKARRSISARRRNSPRRRPPTPRASWRWRASSRTRSCRPCRARCSSRRRPIWAGALGRYRLERPDRLLAEDGGTRPGQRCSRRLDDVGECRSDPARRGHEGCRPGGFGGPSIRSRKPLRRSRSSAMPVSRAAWRARRCAAP